MEEKNGSKLVLLVLFSLVFVGFVAFVLVLMFKNRPPVAPAGQMTQRIKTTPAIQQAKGSLTLAVKNSKTAYQKNDLIVVTVVADSAGESISGFDIVLNYNEKILSYGEKKNLVANGFDLFGTAKGDKLVLTGVKKLAFERSSVFRETPLVELTFKAIVNGRGTFSLESVVGSKKDSNLISDKNEEILSVTKNVEIMIGESVLLPKLQPIQLTGADVTVTAKEISIPQENCRDCITAAILEIARGAEIKRLEFKSGGFAGYMMTPQKALGYIFSVENLKREEVELLYTKDN